MSFVLSNIRPGTLRLRVEAFSAEGPSRVNGTPGLFRRPRKPKPRERTGILTRMSSPGTPLLILKRKQIKRSVIGSGALRALINFQGVEYLVGCRGLVQLGG